MSVVGSRGRGSDGGSLDVDLEGAFRMRGSMASHTAEEQLIVISGAVLAEMIDHPPTRLGPGGFAMMASHMPHQFSCQGKSTCLMIVAFDRPYDIHWGKGG
jgi:quercetin dioxygenase-like cupin family protein